MGDARTAALTLREGVPADYDGAAPPGWRRSREDGSGMSMRTVPSSRGVDVALHDLGGDGEPLFIGHATGFHGRMYAPLAAGLRERFHVWALDFRGHGASSAPDDGDFSWQGMADDLLNGMAAVGAERAYAVGHSMGGGAVLLAEHGRPGSIIAAYTYEPIVMSAEFIARRGENPMSGPARRRREVFASREEVMWRYAGRPPLNLLRADALSLYVQHGFIDLPDGTVQLACRAEAEARTFEAEDKLTIELVGSVSMPVVVGVGRADGGVGPSQIAAPLAAALPNGHLLEYPHLGHFGPFQAPEQVAADILAAFA